MLSSGTCLVPPTHQQCLTPLIRSERLILGTASFPPNNKYRTASQRSHQQTKTICWATKCAQSQVIRTIILWKGTFTFIFGQTNKTKSPLNCLSHRARIVCVCSQAQIQTTSADYIFTITEVDKNIEIPRVLHLSFLFSS